MRFRHANAPSWCVGANQTLGGARPATAAVKDPKTSQAHIFRNATRYYLLQPEIGNKFAPSGHGAGRLIRGRLGRRRIHAARCRGRRRHPPHRSRSMVANTDGDGTCNVVQVSYSCLAAVSASTDDVGLTSLPDFTFCTPSETTRSPSSNPSVTITLPPWVRPSSTERRSALLS